MLNFTRVFLRVLLLVNIVIFLPFPSYAQKTVLVTIPPEKYFVEQIGGNFVKVVTLVSSEIDPHTYEPKPSDFLKLAHTDLFIAVGTLEFERKWLPKFKKMFPQLKFASLFEGLPLSKPLHKSFIAPEGIDPHIWLSPPLVILESRVIYKHLYELVSDKKALEANYKRWIAKVTNLDKELMDTFRNYRGSTFLTYHPAWNYFAEAYDLVQLSVEVDGKKPGPKKLGLLVKTIRSKEIPILFVHSVPAPLIARKLATTLDLQLKTINPLEYEWEKNMEMVSKLILQSFALEGKTHNR